MRLFEKIRMARLGVTERNVRVELEKLEKIEPIDDVKTEVLAAKVMRALQVDNPEDWCEADKLGFDWQSLLDLISVLIEMLMPFIVKQRPPIPVYTYAK